MSKKEEKVARYREANKEVLPGQTVFAGSSLMEQFPIEKFLREHGDETIIYNRGVSGFVSAELLEHIGPCILDLRPARLFINIGTNDLSRAEIPISQMIDTYERIVTTVEAALPDVEIYLMAYYPVNFDAASEEMKAKLKIRTNEKIASANREVEKLAARHGQRYIDINAPLKDELGRLRAEYTVEGMHINECGYAAIYDEIMAYVHEPRWKK